LPTNSSYVDALDGQADLSRVQESAERGGVGRTIDVGVGGHDHGVLAAELQADRRERVRGAFHDDLPGPLRARELDEVARVDEGPARLAHAVDDIEDVRGADVLLPGARQLQQGQRRELRRLDDQ
jgi:hypothetical protein